MTSLPPSPHPHSVGDVQTSLAPAAAMQVPQVLLLTVHVTVVVLCTAEMHHELDSSNSAGMPEHIAAHLHVGECCC
jgi:hypothetical protein